MQKLPGGLIHVNVVGCALFAAISGSSAATVATVGKMSIPELRKRNYPEKILLGSLAGSGTLGLLIPPSIILIIYGVAVQESIAKLFIAGIIPGIMIALIFMSYVIIWSLINKKSMPKMIEEYSFLEKIKRSKQLLPVIILILAVIGSIYTGVATAVATPVYIDPITANIRIITGNNCFDLFIFSKNEYSSIIFGIDFLLINDQIIT